LGLPRVNVNVETPPTLIVDGVNCLENVADVGSIILAKRALVLKSAL